MKYQEPSTTKTIQDVESEECRGECDKERESLTSLPAAHHDLDYANLCVYFLVNMIKQDLFLEEIR